MSTAEDYGWEMYEEEQVRVEREAMRRRMLAGERGYDIPPAGQVPLDSFDLWGFRSVDLGDTT